MQKVHRRSFRPVTVEEKEVATCYRQVRPNSAAGPDNISSKTLRECTDSLARCSPDCFSGPWMLTMFRASEKKSSNNIPVAKKRSPREMNDFRPVALTSVPFNCAEKNVLRRLRTETAEHQDPMQFAYCRGRSTEDVILTLLHRLYQ